jgi:hypothetical protein
MAKLDPQVKRWLHASFALAALLPACGRRTELLGFVGSDAGPDAVSLTPPRFAAPTLVAALSDTGAIDEDPTFTADLLELLFMSNRDGTRDIWTSRRPSADAPWGSPTRVAELDSAGSDWAPAVSLDGLRIWFASDRDTSGRGQLWRSSRAARSAAWNAPEPVAELASGSVDFAPAVDATETLLFFSSDRTTVGGSAGGANFDLYWSERAAAAGTWDAPAAVPGTNSPSDEYDPFVAQGGLVVFFTSMRSGMGDLYWSARRSIAEPFAPPVPLADLNSDAYDSDSSLSVDLGYMMFSSTRSGNAELYETHALP